MSVLRSLTHPTGQDGAHEHARRLLRSHGFEVARVVRVDVDSILYVDRQARPRTAWLRVEPAGLVVHDEPGFSARNPTPV